MDEGRLDICADMCVCVYVCVCVCVTQLWDRRLMDSNSRTRRAVGVFVGHTEGLTHLNSKGDGNCFIRYESIQPDTHTHTHTHPLFHTHTHTRARARMASYTRTHAVWCICYMHVQWNWP